MKLAHFLIAASLVLGTGGAPAYDSLGGEADSAPSAAGMAADLLLVRPLGLAATIVGTGLFIINLPFSIILGEPPLEPAKKLVLEPARYTFARRLGSSEYTY